MDESKFQEYYQEVRERDQKIADERPLPEAKGVNVCSIFGLALGISSMVLAVTTRYTIVLAVIALLLSFLGYRKQNCGISIAGLICSSLGLLMGILVCVIW